MSTACVAGPLASDIFSEFDVPWDQLKPSLIKNKGQLDSIVAKLENHVDKFVDCVGEENFNIELQFNDLGAQHLANRVYIELAKKTGLPLVAAADSHYCLSQLKILSVSFIQKMLIKCGAHIKNTVHHMDFMMMKLFVVQLREPGILRMTS